MQNFYPSIAPLYKNPLWLYHVSPYVCMFNCPTTLVCRTLYKVLYHVSPYLCMFNCPTNLVSRTLYKVLYHVSPYLCMFNCPARSFLQRVAGLFNEMRKLRPPCVLWKTRYCSFAQLSTHSTVAIAVSATGLARIIIFHSHVLIIFISWTSFFYRWLYCMYFKYWIL